MAEQHRQKVRCQADFLCSSLSGKVRRARILNVGCGPCADVRLAMTRLTERVEADLVLVDADPAAIEFGKRILGEAPDGLRCQFVCEDAFHFVRLARRQGMRFDGVLFGGLFDYLTDRQVEFLLRQAMDLLSPRGPILFSQVSKANQERVFMKWFGDWTLIERDEANLERILRQLQVLPEQVIMYREPTGIAILAEISRATNTPWNVPLRENCRPTRAQTLCLRS